MVRDYRVALGLSQNQLARLALVDPAYINRIERSPVTPQRDVTLQIARALALEGAHADRFLWAAGHAPDHDYIAEVMYYREALRALNKAAQEAAQHQEDVQQGT